MILYKTREEISLMKESALLLGKAHGEVAKLVKAGVQTKYLNQIAEEYIKDNGAHPSFLNYNGFPASLCISVNEIVVHGFPSSYELKDGDIISIDCGVFLNGYHADSAYTYAVGDIDDKTKELLEVTKKSLSVGIENMKLGGRIGDVSSSIQSYAESKGFSIVRELVGHGLGKNLHEKPDVPNFGKRGRGVKIDNGLVIAIEPMINQGKRSVVQERDGWTIRTKDRKPSAHYEHTVAMIDNKVEVLTTFEYIEEALKTQYA
ncbi:type I methionyl aminopeptidase [Flammeovirgaceae bacterium SG7u.111]|nr:type I methionyl aminopeptidase [Flammeovirgaceae bacterium SG7u.132]WPO35866.1 type I methionyl aminopeptidase [Flammeovirgaceae bacterium SG7u.111]